MNFYLLGLQWDNSNSRGSHICLKISFTRQKSAFCDSNLYIFIERLKLLYLHMESWRYLVAIHISAKVFHRTDREHFVKQKSSKFGVLESLT